MIIQCEQCQTKFRLDDAKVTDKGVKVRCAKCKHVFSVKREQTEAEVKSDFGAMLDQSVSLGNEEEETSAPVAPQQENRTPEPSPGTEFESSEFIAEDFFGQSGRTEADEFEPIRVGLAPAEDEFSFSSMGRGTGLPLEHDETHTASGEVDFAGFDFGDSEMGRPSASAAEALEEEDSEDLESDDEPMFGDAGAAPEIGIPEEQVKPDAGRSGFDSSAAAEPFTVEAALAAAAAEARREERFTPGGIEAAMGLRAPREEPPPLSIASRRKHNPVFSVLIAAATVVAVALLAFFGYSMFSEERAKAVPEAGSIKVRSVDAFFVKNQAAGDLLVITGEAVNAFTKPRAAIQVKGMVYGANNQVLATKSAYCGNPLTKEQLAVLPLDKIEAAMANQFGDSLANMEVAPGKAIPYVIVIAKPPLEGKEFGVEPLGSTVASGKQ